MNNISKPLIILTGPTAAGKTALSLSLAKKCGGEIISADSMQVYRRMDVGTAKIMPTEMQGIRHHMIDILEPTEAFNVSLFKEYAKKAAEDIYRRDGLPIVVGGTGFYIQALLYDIDFTEETGDFSYREELGAIAQENGGEDKLYDMLKEIDPESAVAIHKNNVKRVIRALEFYHNTGMKISVHNSIEKNKTSPYNFHYFVLTMDREKLYKNIDLRVDKMVSAGLLDEVEGLLREGLNEDHISMQGIGYKEVMDFFRGRCTREECIENIKLNTRHFAKRQLTWFRREKDVIWINKDEYKNDEEILNFIMNKIR